MSAKKAMAVQKLRSRTGAYEAIVQVNVPVRFYWDTNGEFDGIEIGPLPRGMTRYQHRILNELLDELGGGGEAGERTEEEAIAEHLASREQAVKQAEKIVSGGGTT